MKNSCFIIALLICIFSYGQDEVLYGVDWRLNVVFVDSQVYSPLNNTIVGLVFENEAETFFTYVCGNLNGALLFDNPNESFTFPDGINFTPIECENSENTTFEEIYFHFF